MVPISLSMAVRIVTGRPEVGERWAADYPLADEIGLLRLVVAASTEPQGWGPWQVRSGSTGAAIGGIGFLGGPDRAGQVEVGFGLVPSVRGTGIAVEALGAIAGWAFANGAGSVYGCTRPDNLASQRTLSRAGFSRLAGRGDDLVFALVAE